MKRPAIKKAMHCVNFFGTNDFAWIEEFNIKDYLQFKDTLAKSKANKQMKQAQDEMDSYLKSRDSSAAAASAISEDNEEFDALVATNKKPAKKGAKKTESRKREANDSDSSASGPSSTSPVKKARTGTKQKERKEEPSSSLTDPEQSPLPSHCCSGSHPPPPRTWRGRSCTCWPSGRSEPWGPGSPGRTPRWTESSDGD